MDRLIFICPSDFVLEDYLENIAMNETAPKGFIDLTASIVSAYVSNNATTAAEIPALISQIHAALVRVSTGGTEAAAEPAKPAVSVKKSMTADYLVCLEDGKRFKSLKRHLRTQYNMSPEQRQSMGQNGKMYYQENLSADKGVSRTLRLLEKCAAQQ